MEHPDEKTQSHWNTEPGCVFEIRVQGRLSERWSEWFEGLEIHSENDSITSLRGILPDQSALFGVLNKIHGLNLGLVSVTRLSPEDEKGG